MAYVYAAVQFVLLFLVMAVNSDRFQIYVVIWSLSYSSPRMRSCKMSRQVEQNKLALAPVMYFLFN